MKATTIATLVLALCAAGLVSGAVNEESFVELLKSQTPKSDLDGYADCVATELIDKEGFWNLRNDCDYTVVVNWCNPDVLYSCRYADKTRIIHAGEMELVDINSSSTGRVLVLASCRFELPTYEGIEGIYDNKMFLCHPGRWRDAWTITGNAVE